MSESIIKVEGLGKKYVISHEKTAGTYTALRDVISNKAKAVIRKEKQPLPKEEFWALKDVSFEIQKGETVGIIGRNGAGKSTLLKMLSRITEPTKGRIELNGRIASLLEVGTGFHPELTGRENIFLNGAILGMSRAEIRSKFDEIVEFSGVEKFLDTPVKRYSSGMYVRLAFAVAAHLEPEILVVDEVLAVGDAEFQKKCLGKMNEVSTKQGRTVLFVSHNIAAIQELCKKGLLLTNGTVTKFGDIDAVISKYYLQGEMSVTKSGFIASQFEGQKSYWAIGHKLILTFSFPDKYANCYIDITFYDSLGARLFSIHGTRGNKLKVKSISEIQLRNPGFVNMSITVDIGLKNDQFENYVLLERNVLTIETSFDELNQIVVGNISPEINFIYAG